MRLSRSAASGVPRRSGHPRHEKQDCEKQEICPAQEQRRELMDNFVRGQSRHEEPTRRGLKTHREPKPVARTPEAPSKPHPARRRRGTS